MIARVNGAATAVSWMPCFGHKCDALHIFRNALCHADATAIAVHSVTGSRIAGCVVATRVFNQRRSAHRQRKISTNQRLLAVSDSPITLRRGANRFAPEYEIQSPITNRGGRSVVFIAFSL
jgi:hypothetical protein